MGAEQADGLMNQENKPTLTEILSSTDEQTTSETNKNQNLTQYYYERKEINTSNKKSEEKENIKEEPDSTTIIGNRVIQVGKPTTIYEKRVISKTIKRDGNINNNTTTTTTQTKIIKTETKRFKLNHFDERSSETNDTPDIRDNFYTIRVLKTIIKSYDRWDEVDEKDNIINKGQELNINVNTQIANGQRFQQYGCSNIF